MRGEHQRVRNVESERRPVLIAVLIGSVLLVVFALSLGSVFVFTRIDPRAPSLAVATTTVQPVVAAAQQTPVGSVPSPSTVPTVLVAGGVDGSATPPDATSTAAPTRATATRTVPARSPTSAPSPTVPATPTSPPPPTMSATPVPATPTSPPPPTPTAVPPTAVPPTATPTAVPPTATPTVPPPSPTASARELIRRLGVAEERLRSGEFDVVMDLGNGTRSTAQLRFDLAPDSGPARLYIRTRYESGGNTTDVEQVLIGDRIWERNPDGTWRVVEQQVVTWEVIYTSLPRASTVPPTATVSGGVPATLGWYDEARSSDITVTLDPRTGVPVEMRRTERATGSSFSARYSAWNTPVDIPDPETNMNN